MPLAFQQPGFAAFRRLPFFAMLAAALAEILLVGCASPGAPVTRNTQKPQPIVDLSATQSGNSVVLSFTLPTKTVRGQNLAGTPAIEIYRAFGSVSTASPEREEKPRLLDTIPPQMVNRYSEAGRVTFPDMLTPEDLAAHAGTEAVYEVRTRIGRSNSDSSNLFRLPVLPVPQPIRDLRAEVADGAVGLAWSAGEILPAGSTQPALTYNVYRSEVSGSSTAQASGGQASAPSRAAADGGGNFKLLAETSQPSYADATVQSGRTYAYVVRSVAKYTAGSVESADSNRAKVIFAPASRPEAPAHLVATIAPANQANSFAVELSWAISRETDLAGYNVYRSDAETGAGTRLNGAPILVPVFRDASVTPGQEYFYRVTAVSRAGTESERSAPVHISVPNQP